MRCEPAPGAEQERIEEGEPEEPAFERGDTEPGARHERPEGAEVGVLAQVRRVEHRRPVALAEVPGPASLEDRRHVCAAAGSKDSMDLREVGPFVAGRAPSPSWRSRRRAIHRESRAPSRRRRRAPRSRGKRADTRASRAASRSTAYTGPVASISPSRERAAKSGPSPHPRSASASGPAGSERESSGGSRSTSKWIAVSV